MTTKLEVVVYDGELEGTLEERTVSKHSMDLLLEEPFWWEDEEGGLALLDDIHSYFGVTVDECGYDDTARLLIYEVKSRKPPHKDIIASEVCEFVLRWLENNNG